MFSVRCARWFVVAFTAAACATPRPAADRSPAAEPASGRRAIFVSFDSFSEHRALDTLDPARTPAIRALFRESACADYAIPHFPSVTAPGHAALWTGAYGDVNGVSGNSQPRLPRDSHNIMQLISGYLPEALRAEPIWISAGAAGRRVVGHHVTQAPAPPGYMPVTGERDAALEAARARATDVLAMANVHVVNGYGTPLAMDTVHTERTAPPVPATGWRGLDGLGSAVPPREITWLAGSDTVYALLHGPGQYDRVLVSRTRDASEGVVAVVAPVEREWPRGRQLARHFSQPLEFRTDAGSFFLHVRLFELAPDGSSFMIYQPKLMVVIGNRRDVSSAYAAAVRGWIGNGASRLYERDRLGARLQDGGDGTAELRYLESQELLTRQFMRGSDWAWNAMRAELLADYFPLGDEIDHMWLGLIDRDTPRYRPEVGEPLRAMRERAWEMLDLRLAHLQSLVAGDPNAALFVSGDHGMRTSWRLFRPNAALRDAGLLALDTAGLIDPALSRAVSPAGYYVMLNRSEWQSGTVGPAEEAEVLAAAENALLAARTPEGHQIVTRIFRPGPEDSLGLGGPVGGDLYFETARGYRWSWDARKEVSEEVDADAGHGYPSISPDMHTVFCVYGPAFGAHRIPGLRVIHAAPTVSEWLGTPPPPHARGWSVLSDLRPHRAAR